MLGHVVPYWHGLMLGHLGLFWDMCRPLSWIWAFQCRWIFVHATCLQRYHKYEVRNTMLSSCWAILCYFGICVGLCFGFGHFSVVEFSSMRRGYACLILGLCWAIVGYVGTILGSCWAILVDFVVCVGLCWARVGTILGLFSHISVSLNFRSCNTFVKHTINIKKTTIFGMRCWWFLLRFFGCLCFLSFGHAALRLCLLDLKLMGGHGACANPIFGDGKCWNSAGSWCSFALRAWSVCKSNFRQH